MDSLVEYVERSVYYDSEDFLPTDFLNRVIKGEPPTHLTLPNPPLEYGERKELNSLVPVYASLHRTDTLDLLKSEIYFVDIAIAIQSSRNEWLAKVLNEYPKKLPLRDEATGITVLHVAAKSSHESTLNILLKNTEILKLLDDVDIRGTSPLIVASWYGNFAALKCFLALGCLTSTCISDTKRNALHCAADLTDTQICSQLLKYNSRKSFIDAVDDSGHTPLMIAVRGGSPCVTILLMSGADYRISCSTNGRNILHIAIVFFQNDTLLKLLKSLNDPTFIPMVDLNGDTPFMLAIRLKNNVAVKMLIIYVPITQLLKNSENCIHYLIKHDDSRFIDLILAAARNADYLDWTDSKGRSPLMYAVESHRTELAIAFLGLKKRMWYRNPLSGETVLHVAAYVNNADIMKAILEMTHVADIIDVSDFSGRTAYEIVLSRGDKECYYAFRDSGYTIPEFVNTQDESSLFIAAKKGNYDIVLNLLLSDKFHDFHKRFPSFSKIKLIRAVLQGRVYSSDVFIISGEILDLHAWNKAPEQSHLFRHNIDGENIFHACVKGENLMCLGFIYKYCVHFNKYWQELDEPNIQGNTPLLLATMSGEADIFKFLVQNGADMTKQNLEGQFPLLLMTKHISNHRQLLLDMINECVVEDNTEKKKGMILRVISVSFRIFSPPGVQQLYVIQKMFDVLDGSDYGDILQHPVVEYVIESKWEKLKKALEIRQIINQLTLFFTYLYISVRLWSFPHSSEFLVFLQVSTLILSVTSIFMNLPILFSHPVHWRRELISINFVLSPLCTLIYLYVDSTGVISLEFGTLAVLTNAISVFSYNIGTALGYQVSIFYKVLQRVISHLPLSFILILSFSQCFFILYGDTFNFSNPLHSFIYTVMVLLDDTSSEFPYFVTNNSFISSRVPSYHKNVTLIAFEAITMVLFKIVITISLLNMLIGLSVREAHELEKGGDIHRSKIKVAILYDWQAISNYNYYSFIHYIICVLKTNLTQSLDIPMVLYPFEQPVKYFDIYRLKNIAIKQEDIKSFDLKFLKEDIGYQGNTSAKNKEISL